MGDLDIGSGADDLDGDGDGGGLGDGVRSLVMGSTSVVVVYAAVTAMGAHL